VVGSCRWFCRRLPFGSVVASARATPSRLLSRRG
jgi:hypothetical protein